MSTRRGPPKHHNRYAWKPNAGRKINETEVGGRFRPLSEITGVCSRCKDQIEWKRRYGKYKPLTEPAKCQRCTKRNVCQAYHSLCAACAKDNGLCAKCCCRVGNIIGRDLSEVEAEQKLLDEAIKHARERERRTLLRAMNKGKPNSTEKSAMPKENKVGDLFPSASLEEYARSSRENDLVYSDNDAETDDVDDEEDEVEDRDDEEDEAEDRDDEEDEAEDRDDEEDEAEDRDDKEEESEDGDDETEILKEKAKDENTIKLDRN